jgi:broad specificity phosphatase PhoE
VYASDLRRSWRTAEIAFGTSPITIVRDERLRECDYGLLSRRPVSDIDALRESAVTEPFPGGESYAQVVVRVAGWLHDTRSSGLRQVLVIGHRATLYSLDHLLLGVSLIDAVGRSFRWQPGWVYEV